MMQVGSCVPQRAVAFLVQHSVCRAIGGSHVFRRRATLALHDSSHRAHARHFHSTLSAPSRRLPLTYVSDAILPR